MNRLQWDALRTGGWLNDKEIEEAYEV